LIEQQAQSVLQVFPAAARIVVDGDVSLFRRPF
jgi:hypothetical protein